MKLAFALLLVFLVCSASGLEYFYCHPSVRETKDEHYASTLNAVYIDGVLRGTFQTKSKDTKENCSNSESHKLYYELKLKHKSALVDVVKDSALFAYKQEKNFCERTIYFDFFKVPLSSEELDAIRKDGEKAKDKDFRLGETETENCLDIR